MHLSMENPEPLYVVEEKPGQGDHHEDDEGDGDEHDGAAVALVGAGRCALLQGLQGGQGAAPGAGEVACRSGSRRWWSRNSRRSRRRNKISRNSSKNSSRRSKRASGAAAGTVEGRT